MAKLGTHAIRDIAKQIIRESPGGIRWAELLRRIHKQHPETPENTISGASWDLATRFPNEVFKPSRGLFKAVDAANVEGPPQTTTPAPGEEDFYAPFAEWLKDDLDEVTTVAPLGGGGLKTKWGTPDVVGVYKPLASNLIKFPVEIVSAEVKTDPQTPVVAFGQAMAYRLFSTKAYVVIPRTVSEEDAARLESLAMLFGLGLVLFSPEVKNPAFEIRVRAQRFSPDMFYVNEFADRLRKHNSEVFEQLFA